MREAILSKSFSMPVSMCMLTDETKPQDAKPEVMSELSMDWDDVFSSTAASPDMHAESVGDGLVLSLSNLGRVDIEYISEVTGKDFKTVISGLKGSIYQNPEKWEECFYKGFETAEEYLSGNLRRKLASAKEASRKYDGYFNENIKALRKAMPKAVGAEDIYVTLGSPWVPTDVIDEFIKYMLPASRRYGNDWYTKHDELTGTWEITHKSTCKCYVNATCTYGTQAMPALYILEKTLNMRTICVMKEVSCSTTKSGVKRVIDKNETLAAVEKQEKMIIEFQKWVWSDNKRKKRLEEIYDDRFGCVRTRRFDGSFLQFPGMSPSVSLYPYQKDAVARILFSPNTLLAHDVGAGKTYVMIAAGMEKIRMGLAKKCLYVVPNNITGQWQEMFRNMYPAARLLCIDPKSFKPEKRREILEDVRDGKYDAVIMAYSCFGMVPMSDGYRMNQLADERKALIERSRNDETHTNDVDSEIKRVGKAISDIYKDPQNPGDIFFDDLGFDAMFVDEAHNFKNLSVRTKVSRVLGIGSSGSAKCSDMLDKVRFIQKKDGGGVVFATGTPLTNSVSDAYVIQHYLQPGELSLIDLNNFDAWIGMFAERHTEFEIDVDTSSYRLATRFSRFHNLPELTALLASVADFHQAGSASGLPQFSSYDDVMVMKTPEFRSYLEMISHRADDVRSRRVDRTVDNMLKITTDGRKAALDTRLVMPGPMTIYESKVVKCASKVADIYAEGNDDHLTQLVFCDSSTPKKDFNIYDELKRLLILFGIPGDEIAFIHDATTENKREKLFRDVRDGRIRVIIGSTAKIGMGVNIQDRLSALHHLDVPWRPADMVQREGRILRQGNRNDKVRIFRYITEGSFDAYSWQLLETKQQFISDLLAGSVAERSGNDIEDTVLSYAEVKALAVGNPLVKERVETANELTRLKALQRKTVEAKEAMKSELSHIPDDIRRRRELVEKCKLDKAHALSTNPLTDKDERAAFRKKLLNAVMGNELETRERSFTSYRGFAIVLPANMTKDNPYVFLEGEGRYRVELGGTERGDLTRLDNFIDSFGRHLSEMQDSLKTLKARKKALETELAKDDGYPAKINECMKRLEDLDRKLGVKK